MFCKKAMTASVGAALAMGIAGASLAAAPQAPAAVADAYLLVDNFTILAGDGAGGKSFTPLPLINPVGPFLTNVPTGSPAGVYLHSVETTAEVSARIGAGAATENSTAVGLGGTFSMTVTEGAGGLFTPGTTIGGNAPGTFAGSHTSSVGNALNPATPDTVPVHNQVSLKSNTTGSATANQNLTTEFSVHLLTEQVFEVEFLGDGYLRSALGQSGPGNNTTASYSWSARIVGPAGSFDWRPNGAAAGAGMCGPFVCNEFNDAFDMLGTTGRNSAGEDLIDETAGRFELEITLPAGFYTFTIAHQTNANARLTYIPEPGTVALLGLGLLGFGLARKAKQR